MNNYKVQIKSDHCVYICTPITSYVPDVFHGRIQRVDCEFRLHWKPQVVISFLGISAKEPHREGPIAFLRMSVRPSVKYIDD